MQPLVDLSSGSSTRDHLLNSEQLASYVKLSVTPCCDGVLSDSGDVCNLHLLLHVHYRLFWPVALYILLFHCSLDIVILVLLKDFHIFWQIVVPVLNKWHSAQILLIYGVKLLIHYSQ